MGSGFMARTLRQDFAESNGNKLPGVRNTLRLMGKHLRQVIVANIRQKLGDHLTAADLHRLGPVWPQGDRKAGARISARSLRYLFDDSDETSDPGLNMILGIANLIGCEVWELLIDGEDVRLRALATALGLKGTLEPLQRLLAQAKSADAQVAGALSNLLGVINSTPSPSQFTDASRVRVESPETGLRKPSGDEHGRKSTPVRGRRTR